MMKNRRSKRRVSMIFLVLFVAGILALAGFKRDTVAQNVWAFGVPIGGLRIEDAVSLIESKTDEIRNGPFIFKAGELSYEVSKDDLEVLLDAGRITEQLEQYTESRSVFLPSAFFRKGPKTEVETAPLINFPTLHSTALEIANNLSRPPEPERYGFLGHDIELYPPKKGQTVSVDDVIAAIENLSGTTVEVPFQTIESEESLGLEPLCLVSSFETNYDLHEVDRNVNLDLAAQAVHGQVLMPGQVYSFNRTAGERSVARGYRYANVVVGNTLVPDVGGGICQVTTTLFNAAAESGLEFPEIHAHGIPVDYVEPGLDAAVAWNYLDIKIKNDFDHPVVFGAWVENGKVLVNVYGKVLGTEYELEPVILEEYPEEGKNPGLLVETYRLEKQDGEITRRQLLVRSYYLPSYPK
jgi:vancomycin resistance protein YoaR